MDYIIQNDYQPFQNDLQKLPHTKKTYQANDEILLTNRSYFVVTGRVVEILLLEDGNEHALVAYGPQTMFPPLFSASIAAKDELRYDVIQPTTLWVYDNDSLFNYAQTHSAFSKQLHQSALKHMDYYLNDISQLLSESGMQRLITFLLYYLNEHHPADQLIPIRQKILPH